MSSLTLALLGPFRANWRGKLLRSFRSNKVQALLIYLTVERALTSRHVFPREALTAMLWPEKQERSARQNMRQTLYLLRQMIPEVEGIDGHSVPFVYSDRHMIGTNPDALVELDVARFDHLLSQEETEALKEAVALYRGDFLQDFYLEDSNAFESWAATVRARFHRNMLDVLQTLAARHLAGGNLESAEKLARQQLQLDETREGAHRQLMLALARRGQRAEALEHFQQLRTLLRRELGVPPTAETQKVVEAIRAGKARSGVPLWGRLRGYELHDKIGEGEIGVVYRALQPSVRREVAVKAIRSRFADDPRFIRRFETEAQIVARLEHPHILPLYDYWREPGGAYLVMRWIRGGSLQDQLGRGSAWDTASLIDLVQQIGTALTVAHGQGIVHRDIKPANILIDEEGNAYLSDFGVAKNIFSGNEDRQTGTPLDRSHYSPPELRDGGPVTPRSDVYSLGLVLYALCLDGRASADLVDRDDMRGQRAETLPSLADACPGLPPAIDRVLQKATARDAAQRYPGAAALVDAFLQAAGNNLPAPPHTLRAAPRATSPGVPVLNPFKGLRPFEEADARYFYGRDDLTTRLVQRLVDSRFVAVVGPSGSGKSSLVKAGLLPALRDDAIPGSREWFISEMSPGARPLKELEAALYRVAVDPPETLLASLAKDERGLLRVVERILPPSAGDLLLVVDQFEELFTLSDEEAERRHFLQSMVAAASDDASRIRVVIALRADFYDRPLAYQSFGQLVEKHTLAVVPPTRRELAHAIRRPAADVGVAVEEALQVAMVNDVLDQPGALPLLQYALTELFEQRQHSRMTLSDYVALGGITSVLGRRAEALLAGLTGDEQELARQLFLRLVLVDERAEYTRRPALLSELSGLATTDRDDQAVDAAPGVHSPALDRILDLYGRSRLLSFDRDPASREPLVQIAHDALLQEWPRLRNWLEESRDDVRQQRQLRLLADEWLQAGRTPGYLLRGSRLDQFAGWSAHSGLALTPVEQTYLKASLDRRARRAAAEETRRKRELETAQRLAEIERRRAQEQAKAAHELRQRATFLGVAVLLSLLLALAAGLFSRQATLNERKALALQATAVSESQVRTTAQANANRQQLAAEEQARVAQSRELAAAALVNREIDPDRSILLALEAVALTETLEARNALRAAIQASSVELAFVAESGQLAAVAYSPDGRLLATSGNSSTAMIWEASTGQEVVALQGHDAPINYVGFAANGDYVVTGGDDMTARIWELASGKTVQILRGHADWVTSAAFSPDGAQVATSSIDGTARLWDARTGQQTLLIRGGRSVNHVAFSPDGRLLATAESDANVARVWDLDSSMRAGAARTLATFTGSGGQVTQVAFSPDGEHLAVYSWDGVIQVWRLDADASGGPVATLSGATTGSVNNVAFGFNHDGTQIIAIAAQRALLTTWDARTGQNLSTFVCHPGLGASVALSPGGREVAVAGTDGTVRVCRLPPSRELLTLSPQDRFLVVGALTADGARLYGVSRDGILLSWSVADPTGDDYGDLLREVVLDIENETVAHASISPDETRLATAGSDGRASLWDLNSGVLLEALSGHTQPVLRVAFSPDGARLATVSMDTTARIWELAGESEPLVLSGHTMMATDVAFSPDGTLLATSAADGSTRIWDARTGVQLSLLAHPTDQVWSVAFSPDGTRLATGDISGVISIWDIGDPQTPVPVASIAGHTQLVFELAFSPDGEWLASGGLDSLVKLWRADGWHEEATLAGHTNNVSSLQFASDRRRLVSTSWDGTARFFLVHIEELVTLARSRVTRSLTDEECRRYLHVAACPQPSLDK